MLQSAATPQVRFGANVVEIVPLVAVILRLAEPRRTGPSSASPTHRRMLPGEQVALVYRNPLPIPVNFRLSM